MNRKNSINRQKCKICGSKENIFLFENHDRLYNSSDSFGIFKCKNCGVVYIDPQPQNIEKFYKSNYEPYNIQKEDFYQKIITSLTVAYYKKQKGFWGFLKAKIYQIISDPIPLKYLGGKVLDIGCGNGAFLHNLKKTGNFEIYGIDFSPYAVEQAKNVFGLENIFFGALKTQKFPDDFFDVVVMSHVIEHLTDPQETLNKVSRILRKGGLIILTTPNSESINFKIFKKSWFALETPRHLNIFSLKSLQKMVQKTKGPKIKKVNYHISNYVFAKSLVYFFNIKNGFIINFLMRIKILFSPFFLFLPSNKKDIMTLYIEK